MKKSKLLLISIALISVSLLLSCKKNHEGLDQSIQNLKASDKISLNSNDINERRLAATPLEYQQASTGEKQEIDQFQIAFDALFTSVEGVITFRLEKATPDIIDGPVGPIDPAGESCTVCGTVSAMKCISKIKSYMDKKNLSTLSVTVRRVRLDGDNCVSIEYKQDAPIVVTPIDPGGPTDPGPTNPTEKYVINPNTGTPVINSLTGEYYDINIYELDLNQWGQPIYDPDTMQPLIRIKIIQVN